MDKRQHVYQDINGWFDYETVYKDMVKVAPSGSHFVEVGSFVGRSAAFMAIEIINSGKNIKFDCVDCWGWNAPAEWHWSGPDRNVEHCFDYNIKKYSLETIVNKKRADSFTASKSYQDKSLQFIFLDAAHDYENIIQDINCWLPKVKVNGYIGGHDYSEQSPGVIKAVNHIFGNKVVLCGNPRHPSWLVLI